SGAEGWWKRATASLSDRTCVAHPLSGRIATLDSGLHIFGSMLKRALIFPAAMILGLVGGIALRPYLGKIPPPLSPPGFAEAAPHATTEPVSTASTDGIELKLRRDGKMVRVTWDRNAPLLRDANEAQLYILDGDHQSKLKLSDTALHSGML